MSNCFKWVFALMATGITSVLVYDYFTTGGEMLDRMSHKMNRCKCEIADDLEDMM